MKTLSIFVCLLLSCTASYQLRRAEKVVVGAAVREFIREYFAKSSPHIVIVILGVRGGFADTLANEMMKRMPDNITAQVKSLQHLVSHLESSAILLIDSTRYFKKLSKNSNFLVSQKGIWHKHLLYVPGLEPGDIAATFSSDYYITEVSFLVNFQGTSVDLATAFLFSPEACNKNQIRTINRYSYDTNRWENSNFYPKKYQNFHGCTIEVKVLEEMTNMIGKRIFETLAKSLNFKLKRTILNKRSFSKLASDYHMTEVVAAQDNTLDLLSSAIYFDALAFAVPPGKPLTDLERMFAAFDNETWIAIGATFAIALIAILVVKLMSNKVQNFVFGQGIRTPILNVFDIFLNGGQNRIPGRNFARYLLMMFIIWSLIFRTCYQSMMFEDLNSDMRHPRVKTIAELKEKNFTLLCKEEEMIWTQSYGNDLNYTALLPDDVEWYDIVPEPANKFTFLIFRTHFSYFVTKELEKVLPSVNLLQENFVTIPFYIVLPNYIPFTPVFKEQIDFMLANGMIQKWHDRMFLIERDQKRYEDTVDPQVLTVASLKLGFMAFLISLTVCFAVFLIELAVNVLSICMSRSFD